MRPAKSKNDLGSLAPKEYDAIILALRVTVWAPPHRQDAHKVALRLIDCADLASCAEVGYHALQLVEACDLLFARDAASKKPDADLKPA